MKKIDLNKILMYQDTDTLVKLLKENNNYFEKIINNLQNNKEININYILYLILFNNMIFKVLESRLINDR